MRFASMGSSRWLLLIILVNLGGLAALWTFRIWSGPATSGSQQSAALQRDTSRTAVDLVIPQRPVIGVEADAEHGQSNAQTLEVRRLQAYALDMAEELVRALPHNPLARCLLGKVHLRCGSPAGAQLLWEQALELDPQCAEALIDLGHYQTHLGHDLEAANYFRRALVIDAGALTVYLPLAEALQRSGDHAAASEVLESFLRRSPDSVAAWTLLGQAQSQQGKQPAAIHCYQQALQRDAQSREAMIGLMTAYRAHGDAGAADRIAQDLTELSSAQPRAAGDRAAVDLDDLRTHDWLSFICQSAADIWMAEKNDPAAVALLEASLETFPALYGVRRKTAYLLAAQGQAARGAQLLEQGSESAETDVSRLQELAEFCIKSRQLPAAAAALTRLLKLQPGNAAALSMFAQVEMSAGRDPRQAVEYARRAAASSPTAGHYYVLATALYHAGAPDEARKFLNKAIEMEPNNNEFRDALRRL